MGRKRASFARVLFVVALCLIAGAAATGWLHASTGQDIVRVLLLTAAVVCAVVACALLRRSAPKERPPGDPPFHSHPEWLLDLQQEITKDRFQDDVGAIISLIELLTNPARSRSRVVETIGLEGRSIQQEVHLEFVLRDSSAASSVLYLPVLLPRKGELIDNFKLSDTSDNTITNLSYDETTRLVAIGLRTMLLAFTGLPWNETRDCELMLLSIITKRGPADGTSQDARINSALNKIGTISPDRRKLITAYVSSLSVSYPIVAVV